MRRLVLIIGSLLTLAAIAAPAASADQQGTLFEAKTPTLRIRIHVSGQRIVNTLTFSRLHCKGGRETFGGGADLWQGRFPVAADDGFAKTAVVEEKGYELYWRLAGRVRPNRIVGSFASWETPFALEAEAPASTRSLRCGTRTWHGLPRHFVAHRISGPPWFG